MTKNKSKPSRGVSVSVVIATLLITSCIVRIAGGTGQAIAREISNISPSETDAPVVREKPMIAESAEGLDALIAELKRREAEVMARDHALDMRAKDIEAATILLDAKMKELATAEDSLRGLLSLAEKAAESDVAQLTSVYETMKPKEAARVFEEMSPAFAAGFLARMKPDAAAKIFAGLRPGTAFSITAVMAGRNMNVS